MTPILLQINRKNSNEIPFFKKYIKSQELKVCGFYKTRCIPCKKVLCDLIQLIFERKNLYQKLQDSEPLECSKNTYYRFLRNGNQNWERFILETAQKLIQYMRTLCENKNRNAFVVDDTLYKRDRSKKVELLSKVFDHDEMKYRKGFRLLTIGWTDGFSFIPVAFRLISSARYMLNAGKKYDGRTLGGIRRKKSSLPIPVQTLDLLSQLKSFGIRYVLFDSWFGTPKMIEDTKSLGYEIVCRMKHTSKIFFIYKDKKMFSERLLPFISRENFKEDVRIIGSILVQIGNNDLPIKLVFCRDSHSSDINNFQIIASTDIELSSLEIIQMYGKCWNIETFFKMCKSYLRLSSEYEGLSFDGMTAFVSIVFLRYDIIVWEVRNSNDPRSFGEIFLALCDEIQDISIFESILRIFVEAMNDLSVFFSSYLLNQFLDSLLKKFIELIPANISSQLVCSCS